MRGTFNAGQILQLASGTRVEIEEVDTGTPDRVPSLHLVATREGIELWRTVLQGMEPDPTSMASDINSMDYRAFEWIVAGLLVIAGESRAVLVNTADGTVRRALRLGMVGISALDFLEIGELAVPGLLAVVSPRAAWLVDRTGLVAGPYQFDGPIESVRTDDAGNVMLRVYDVGDPAFPVVEHLLDSIWS